MIIGFFICFIIERAIYSVRRDEGKSYISSIIISNYLTILFLVVSIYSLKTKGLEYRTIDIVEIIGYSAIFLYSIIYALYEIKRDREISKIPSKIQQYIASHGYTSTNKFIEYCKTSSDFALSRKIKYPNPEYKRIIKENNGKLPKGYESLKEYFSLFEYIGSPYKEIVLTHFMNELPSVLKKMYMFDYADIFVNMPDFSDFFQIEDSSYNKGTSSVPEYYKYFDDISISYNADSSIVLNTDDPLIKKYYSIDKTFFQQSCIGVINRLISDNVIRRVGNSDLFRSKVISESEGNVVEGETIEISFDE